MHKRSIVAPSTLSIIASIICIGTVLGTLVFLAYINDLPNRVVSSCSLFAEDCLLYRQIRFTENCCIATTESIKNGRLGGKCTVFNIDKYEVLQISLGNSVPVNHCLYDNPLIRRIVNEAKYLGVLLDSKLNFNRHIETICKKANGVLHSISQT